MRYNETQQTVKIRCKKVQRNRVREH